MSPPAQVAGRISPPTSAPGPSYGPTTCRCGVPGRGPTEQIHYGPWPADGHGGILPALPAGQTAMHDGWMAYLKDCYTTVVSPVLSNIYLDRLDQYIGQTLASRRQPGRATHTVSAVHPAVAARLQAPTARRPAGWSGTA
jgi:hypothetical protein